MAPVALDLQQLRSRSRSTGPAGERPPAPAPWGVLPAPQPDTATGGIAPGAASLASARPPSRGRRPAAISGCPGTPVPAVPGRGPGMTRGGTMAVPPAAPLTSSHLFPSLLCTRHAPCEPFLRGIRTKGSWEYLSGTGESGDAAGGTPLPSPGALLRDTTVGIAAVGTAIAGIIVVGIAAVALLTWASSPQYCCHSVTATVLLPRVLPPWASPQWHGCHGCLHRGHGCCRRRHHGHRCRGIAAVASLPWASPSWA